MRDKDRASSTHIRLQEGQKSRASSDRRDNSLSQRSPSGALAVRLVHACFSSQESLTRVIGAHV